MPRLRSPAIVAGCLVLSLAGFACGSDRSEQDTAPRASTPRAPDQRTNIVSNADIRRTRPGTPERAILTWAQAVQFGDVTAVRESYTQRVRANVPQARLDAATRRVATLLGYPEIITTTVRGMRAFVRVALVSYGREGRRSQQPTTFPLRKEQGRWLLDEARLLLESAAALRRSPR